LQQFLLHAFRISVVMSYILRINLSFWLTGSFFIMRSPPLSLAIFFLLKSTLILIQPLQRYFDQWLHYIFCLFNMFISLKWGLYIECG
jgi:hypothetical protein